ncbi:hypothetical protein PANA5342_2475 [Pantoea ananatis LMG 5342]|nr:hypothetical protein PANA5342_2475 [Pantoea ananatis LMG 5342]
MNLSDKYSGMDWEPEKTQAALPQLPPLKRASLY